MTFILPVEFFLSVYVVGTFAGFVTDIFGSTFFNNIYQNITVLFHWVEITLSLS